MKNPIIVALDIDDPIAAYKLVETLHAHVGGFKVGPRLTFRADQKFLKEISKDRILFFDHKFFDIPSTTVSAVKIAAEMGAHWVTVHTLAGPECLCELKKVEDDIRKTEKNFRILGVTVLTSFSEKTLPPIWKPQKINESVSELAKSAIKSGIKSLVCSPEEIKELKSDDSDLFLVTPGIRLSDSPADDQKRTSTPHQAIKEGASALVIGRPIIAHKNPAQVAQDILKSLK